MTIATIARRVAALEARLVPLRSPAPGAPPPWLAWASRGELLELETLLEPIEADERDPTEVDQLLALEIEARATRRMLAGEPPASPLLPGPRADVLSIVPWRNRNPLCDPSRGP